MSLRNRKQFNGRQVIGRALRQGYSGDNGVTAMSGNPQPYPSLYLPEGSISVEDDNVDQSAEGPKVPGVVSHQPSNVMCHHGCDDIHVMHTSARDRMGRDQAEKPARHVQSGRCNSESLQKPSGCHRGDLGRQRHTLHRRWVHSGDNRQILADYLQADPLLVPRGLEGDQCVTCDGMKGGVRLVCLNQDIRVDEDSAHRPSSA
jgi:hypothetical protein